METTFWTTNLPIIISAISAFATLFVVIFKGGKLYNRIENIEKNNEKTSERIDRLEERTNEKIDNTNERIDKLEERTNKLTEAITLLTYRVEQLEKGLEKVLQKLDCLPSLLGRITVLEKDNEQNKSDIKQLQVAFDTYSGRHSPRSLNELGLKMFEQMKGVQFLEKNKYRLFLAIDARQPLTALDVEESSLMVLLNLQKDPIMNSIKDFVYTCPTQRWVDEDGNKRKDDMNLQSACFILSLPLRDAYLKEHPELDVKQ